jgi:predicted nucleic acid-binding Zn ribbon protein
MPQKICIVCNEPVKDRLHFIDDVYFCSGDCAEMYDMVMNKEDEELLKEIHLHTCIECGNLLLAIPVDAPHLCNECLDGYLRSDVPAAQPV